VPQRRGHLTRWCDPGLGQARQRARHVAGIEQQGGRAQMRRFEQAEIDRIAGEGDLWQRRIVLIETDEAEPLPKPLGRFALRRRQPELEKIAAQRGVRRQALAGAEGARLDQADQVAAGIEQPELVEYIVAEMVKLELEPEPFEGTEMAQQFRFDERERGRGPGLLMQSEAEPAVGDHRIRVPPGFADLGLGESESSVKIERRADVRRRDRIFEKSAEHLGG